MIQVLNARPIPAVLGNIIGGVLLVALLNRGQIMAGRKTGDDQP